MSKNSKKDNVQSDVRSDKLKLYSIGSVLILIAIILLANILFDGIFGKVLSFDFSEHEQNTLSQDSLDYIHSLPQDTRIRIVGLFDRPDNVSGTRYQYIIPLLDDYARKSDGRITVEYVNPVEKPSIINELDPDNVSKLSEATNSFVISYNGKAKVINPYDCYSYDDDYYYSTGDYLAVSNNTEYTFTNCMFLLTNGYSCKAYTVTGLQEEGNEYLTMILNSMAIECIELPSSENFVVPDDCDLLILNGPNTDISEKMYVAMTDYINRGGKMFIAVDYSVNSVGEKFEKLNLLTNQMNISIDPALIFENDPVYQRGGYSVDSSVIPTENFKDYTSAPVLHATYTRSISAIEHTGSDISTYPVLLTSNDAELMQYDSDGYGIDSDVDTTGQYNAAMYSVKSGDDSAKMFVFGTLNFTSDEFIQGYGLGNSNVEFFRACVEELISSKPVTTLQVITKPIQNYSINSSDATTAMSTAMLIVFMIILPLLMVALAVIVFTKRKNL